MTEESWRPFVRRSYLFVCCYGLVWLLWRLLIAPLYPGINWVPHASAPQINLGTIILAAGAYPFFRAYAWGMKQRGGDIQGQAGPPGLFLLFHLAMSFSLIPYVSFLLDPHPAVTYRLLVQGKGREQNLGPLGLAYYQVDVASWYSPGDLAFGYLSPWDWLEIEPDESVVYVTSGNGLLGEVWFRTQTEAEYLRHPKMDGRDLVPPRPPRPSLESFEKIRHGMSLQDIAKLVGLPSENWDLGGMRMMTYRAQHGASVMINYMTSDGDFSVEYETREKAKRMLLELRNPNRRVEVR